MPNQYPLALREQIVLEYRQGRSIRALPNYYEHGVANIRRWIEVESDTCIDESEVNKLKYFHKENMQLPADKRMVEKAAAWLALAINRNER